MANSIKNKPEKVSREYIKLKQENKALYDKNYYLVNRINTILENWNGFLITISLIVFAAMITSIMLIARSMYYTNGKWEFGIIVFGCITVIVSLALSFGIVYGLAYMMYGEKETLAINPEDE